MAENSQVLTTSINDVARINHLLVGNSITGFRIGVEKAKRRITVLTKRLIELRANESILKSRFYSTLDQAFISQRLTAGGNTVADVRQSLEQKQVDTKPNADIDYSKYQIYATSPGIKELESEINKMNAEISEVQIMIKKYNKVIMDFETAMQKAEENKSKSLLGKAGKIAASIGNALSPSEADLEKDSISKTIVSNLLLLKTISDTYENYTLDPITFKQKFPDETKLALALAKMVKTFWAHAQSFPELSIGTSTSPPLDFNNPGSKENKKSIEKQLALYRGTAANTKIQDDVNQFVLDTVGVVNDPTTSKGANRGDKTLPAGSSLRDKTMHFGSVVMSLGGTYIGSFELPSLTEGLKKVLKKRAATFLPLPICPNAPKLPETATDFKSSRAEEKYAATIAAGTKAFTDALAAAQKIQDTENAKTTGLIGELPADAPDWVFKFYQTYNEADYGEISYESKLLPPLETTSTITPTAPDVASEVIPGSAQSTSGSLQQFLYREFNNNYAPYIPSDTTALSVSNISVPPAIYNALNPGSSISPKLLPINMSSYSSAPASSTATGRPAISTTSKSSMPDLTNIIITNNGLEAFQAREASKNVVFANMVGKPELYKPPVVEKPSNTISTSVLAMLSKTNAAPPSTETSSGTETLAVTRGVDSQETSSFEKCVKTIGKSTRREIDRYSYENQSGAIIAFILWR